MVKYQYAYDQKGQVIYIEDLEKDEFNPQVSDHKCYEWMRTLFPYPIQGR